MKERRLEGIVKERKKKEESVKERMFGGIVERRKRKEERKGERKEVGGNC